MDIEKLKVLGSAAEETKRNLAPLLSKLAEARRRFATTRTDTDKRHLDIVQAEVRVLSNRFDSIVAEMEAATGLSEEELTALEADKTPHGADQIPRGNLRRETVPTTSNIDEQLPEALDAIYRLLPSRWLDGEDRESCRLSELGEPERFLSLTKSLRRESEFPTLHRLRQAVRVSDDYLRGHPGYDHFAGATVVPGIVRLWQMLENLTQVGGDVDGRLRRLWNGASAEVDSTLLELFTAGSCAQLGRSVEFVAETDVRSPDIRCHDPIPLVIECKRQQALSPYELREEAIIADIFVRLRAECTKLGLCGRFTLRLSLEASALDRAEVASRLTTQRLAPHPERDVSYPWGSVAFEELPRRARLPAATRLYSPNLLEWVFGWKTDLSEWDGLCCWIGNAAQMAMDVVESPVGLVWNNTCEPAIRKRTWAPTNLFSNAVGQIPPGEFGIIYVAYHEGTREELADRRVEAFTRRIASLEHAGNIRIPISYLCRLYPAPSHDGQPDFIESTIRLLSETYGERTLFDYFPETVFTVSPS